MPKFKNAFNKRPVRDGHFPCDDIRPGDGQDPRYDKSEEEPKRAPNRKALQLCSQIMEALHLAFAGMSAETLQTVQVAQVIPAPDSTQLIVTLAVPLDRSVNEVQSLVALVSGRLRAEVARAINRKRVPQLKYVYCNAAN